MVDISQQTLPVKRTRPYTIQLSATSPQRVTYDYASRLPAETLLTLYQTVKNALPDQTCHILQFASAYKGEGAHLIAFETALASATQIGLRVLYIDTAHQACSIRTALASKLETTLDVLLQSGGKLEDALVGIENTHFVYTLLRSSQFKDCALANLDYMDELLTLLRGMYDLIIFPSPHMLADVLCASMTRLADGTLLVVQAERTRAPVARQLKEAVMQNGGKKIIGAILNKRRFYIPRWFYKCL